MVKIEWNVELAHTMLGLECWNVEWARASAMSGKVELCHPGFVVIYQISIILYVELLIVRF